ncbi:MAG: hypothetical protein NTV34_21825, partial [Proteobacteria bacterium]|nr:hypothetical protein [Pseudomonadota bacterium]
MKRFLVLIAVNMLPNGQTIQAREQSILDITLAPAFTAMALVKDQPDYYGSALLWDILRYKREDNAERLKFIFITNAHIIPGPYAINSFATTFDNFGGSIDGGSTEPVRLIAESVGYDLAAWTVDVAADRMDAAQVDRYQVLFKDVFPRLDLPVNSVRVSLVGNPSSRRIGNANTGWIYNAVWSKRLFSVISDPALLSPLDRVFSPPIDVEELTVTCPLVALQSCYRIPIPSSGYSGSAFLMGTDTAVKESKLHPIAGIVHGFEPLSDKTYVIPTKEIWKFYDKVKGLVLESSTPAQQLSKETVIDETESFLQLTMNAATIKIGGLVGKTITALQRSIPGGGLVSGGGGLVSGGGGLVSGGGGSLQLANGSKFTFVQRRLYDDQAGTYVNKQSIPDVVATDRPLLIKNDLATLQSDLLLEILEKTFLFRGVAQQMRYLPGVEMGGAQYLSFDHTPIANFAHFLKLHSDNPFLEPKVDLVSDPFP